MRRLPVYFLIDVSESMIGEPIQQVEEGLATIIKELKRDPYALETVYISIIIFAGKAKTIVPLTDIISFYPPRMPIGGGTSFGTGLLHLINELDSNIVKTTLDRKGDWKPLVFLFTDGSPTDSYQNALSVWSARWKNKSSMVAVSFGKDADLSVLNQLTEEVLVFNNSDANSYTQFFKWITSSIQASSQSVNMGQGDDLNLPSAHGIDLEKAPEAASSGPTTVDSSVATFLVRCQTNRRHYLIKYDRLVEGKEMFGLSFQSSGYRLAGAYPLSDEYFTLSSGDGMVNSSVSSDNLIGAPNCPCCGNPYGLSKCPCGKLFCADDSDRAHCPWCERDLHSGAAGGPIDLSRTQG